MIGDSFVDGIIIHAAVTFFRYTPLIYILSLASLYLIYGEATYSSTLAKALTSLLIAESLFFVFIYLPCIRRLNQKAVHPSPLSSKERWALFNQCMANVQSMELYLQWWFLGAKLDEIRRENLRDFLLWGFFDAYDDQVLHGDEQAKRDLEQFVAHTEQRLSHPVKSGRGSAKCIRLTFDEIETTYRSLVWYIVIFIIDQATHIVLSWYGFKYYARSPALATKTFPPRPQEVFSKRRSCAPQLGYWYTPPSSKKLLPIVFFHGIGVGLWTYIHFLLSISAVRGQNGDQRVGVIALEILPVSFRLTDPPLTKAEFLQQMSAILDYHGWDEFAISSHSYGSVPTTHMLHSPTLRDKIKSVVLIDPVTIMLHLPDVAYNFTRRQPKKPNEWQLWYFAGKDPGVAHCLGRHFFWRENIIWKEDLLSYQGIGRSDKRRVAVCLAGRDILVDAPTVAQYLKAIGAADFNTSHRDQISGVEVVMFPELDHAQVFDSQPDFERLVRLVRSYSSI